MANNEQTPGTGTPVKSRWRRHAALLGVSLLIAIVLLTPWNASVGNYGTLIAIPAQETIVRAPKGQR